MHKSYNTIEFISSKSLQKKTYLLKYCIFPDIKLKSGFLLSHKEDIEASHHKY